MIIVFYRKYQVSPLTTAQTFPTVSIDRYSVRFIAGKFDLRMIYSMMSNLRYPHEIISFFFKGNFSSYTNIENLSFHCFFVGHSCELLVVFSSGSAPLAFQAEQLSQAMSLTLAS